MEQDCKQNVTPMEQIRERMKQKGWKQADLARATGVSTAVLSRFFANDGISDRNLFHVMTALDFFKGETIQVAPNSNKGGQGTGLSEDNWQMKTIIEQLGKRLDRQDQHINDIVKVMTRYKDETDRIHVALENLRLSDVGINSTLDEINATLVRIKGRLADAAQSGRVEDLGGEIVNE